MCSARVFAVDDYVLFGIVLCIYLFSGYYFAQARGQPRNSDDFVLASGSLGGKVICLSLASSMLPGLAILILPLQLYYKGIVIVLICVAYAVGITVTCFIYLPIFSHLKTRSIFSFLKVRFSRHTQLLAMIIHCLYSITFCVLNAYVSISALSKATGFPFQTVVLIGSVTTLYSIFGGLRAVVWNQVFQYFIVCIGLTGFVIKGLVQQGLSIFTSFSNLGDASQSSIVPTWYTTVTLVIGGSIHVVSVIAVNQSYIQRALALKPNKRKRFFLSSLIALSVAFLLLFMSALVINATTKDCSYEYPSMPFLQILPYTVTHGLKHHPGMPGFFLAVIFSSSMSFTASALHSMSTVFCEDVIKTTFSEIRDSVYLNLLKVTVVCFGLIVTFVPLVMNGNQAEQLALSIPGLLGGPLLGLFTLGIFFSRVDGVAASVGCVFSIAVNIWSYTYGSKMDVNTLPHLQLVGCNSTSNGTLIYAQAISDDTKEEHVWHLLFSYTWYAFSGFVVAVAMGMTTGLVRGCRPHKNSETSFFKSISPSSYCICFGKKGFRSRDTNLDNDDYDYYGGDDDDDSEDGRNHREFHELELYHRSPFRRGSNSRWFTEGNRFYEQDSTEGAAARIEQRRPFIGRRSSSMASSTDSAYATVRGFDLINQIAQIHELENYEEEPINRSAHTEHVEEVGDKDSKMQSVGRFNVAKVPLKESSTQNTSSLDEPSTSKRGRFTVTPLKEKKTEAITTSAEHETPTCSVNPKETHCERTARAIFYDNDKQTIKNNRFQVSKISLNAIPSSETNSKEKSSNAVEEVYKDIKKSSSTNDPRSPDHKGRFLISKCNKGAIQLPIVRLFSPNRSSFVAPDIGNDLLLEIDTELFSRDQAYLETEL